MSINYELIHKTKTLVEKEIDELISKGCLTQSENATLKDAYKILVSMATLEQMDGSKQSNNRFSYGDEPPYGSYGYPNEIAQRHMFDGRVMPPNGAWSNSSYNDSMGRSSHSAIDKMVASLEKSMGEATSEYEKQEIQEEIHRLRMREMK